MSSLTGFHTPAFPPQDRFIHLALKSPGGFTEPAAMNFSLLKRLLSRIHPNPSVKVLGAQPRRSAQSKEEMEMLEQALWHSFLAGLKVYSWVAAFLQTKEN